MRCLDRSGCAAPRRTAGLPTRNWLPSTCKRPQRARVLVRAVANAQDVDHLKDFGFKRDATRYYELGKLIGAGTFGTVYEATCRRTGKQFAIKAINKRYNGEFLEYHFVNRVQHEVDIYLHMGNSLNVAHLWDVFEDDSCVDLVMERCHGGELWKHIRQGKYQERDAAKLIREILRTVSQFHANDVVIRDVKPENFLFAEEGETSHLKAIDFGIAQYCRADQTLRERAGTPIYVAPEVLKMEYSQKADLWSAGILSYQLLTGRLPFIGETGLMVSKLYMAKQIFTNKDVFRAILYADLDFAREPWPDVSEGGKQLVQSLLTRDPAKRPTAAEALAHPWFAQLEEGGALSGNASNGNGASGSDGANGANGSNGTGTGAPGGAPRAGPLLDSVVQRLQRFGTYGRLKQVALRQIASAWLPLAGDQEMVAEIRATFEAMDAEGNGKVPYSAVVAMLKRGDFDISETETEVLISQMDVSEQGYVQYEDWLAAMVEWRTLQESAEWDDWVAKGFQTFDVDGNGSINAQDLAAILCKDGVCAMPDVVAAALREADGDGDQQITLDDFVRLVHLNRGDNLANFGHRRRHKRV